MVSLTDEGVTISGFGRQGHQFFFMHVIAPHVLKYQKPALHVKFANLSSPTSQQPSKGKEDFVNRLKCKLEFVVKEAPREEAWNTFYGGNVSSEMSVVSYGVLLDQKQNKSESQ